MSRSAYLCSLAGMFVLALSWDLRTRLRALGFFAAVPIAYLVLVVAVQVLKPLLT